MDEAIEDLSKPVPREPGDYVKINRCPEDFPEDLKRAMLLVIEHDRMVAGQMSEEIRTYLAVQEGLPRSERHPIEVQNPYIAKLMSLDDMNTCLRWREEWLLSTPTPRPKSSRP